MNEKIELITDAQAREIIDKLGKDENQYRASTSTIPNTGSIPESSVLRRRAAAISESFSSAVEKALNVGEKPSKK